MAFISYPKRKPNDMPDWAWRNRHIILSQFDRARVDGGFYAMCPEPYADDIARRVEGETVLDACAGLGGMTLAFARARKNVIACEIDPTRLEMAQHNACVYGVSDRIQWLCQDSSTLKDMNVDTVVFDPPWGDGPGDYKKKDCITMEDLSLGEADLRDVIEGIACQQVVMRLPNNFDFANLGQSLREKIVPYRENWMLDMGDIIFSCMFATREEFLSIPRHEKFA